MLGGHLRLRLQARVDPWGRRLEEWIGRRSVVGITSVYGCKMRCLLSSGPTPASFIAPRDVKALQT